MAFFASLVLFLMFWAARGDVWETGRSILFLAFVFRGVTAIALRLQPLPSLYTADAGMYDEDAWAIAQAWLSETDAAVPAVSFNVAAYERFAAGVYLTVGRSVLTMQILGALAGALAVYYSWRAARELIGGERAAVIGILLAAWPSHVLWTSQNIRDPWAFFFISRTMWSGVLWLKYARPREWVKALCFAGLVGVFRLLTGMLLGALLLAMSAHVAWRATRWEVRLPVLGLAAGGVLFVWWVGGDSEAWSGLAMWSPASLSQVRQALATGGSAFYPELSYESWLDVVRFAPVGLVYVLFAPFPWDVENAAQLGTGLENAVLYVLVAAGLLMPRGLRMVGERPGAFVALVVLCGFGALAVIEGNVGTAYRHKMQYLPCLLMLVGAGWPLGGGVGWRGAEPLAWRASARAAL